jgi:Astacin (Peptidase family M12A)/IPT/TIG domain
MLCMSLRRLAPFLLLLAHSATQLSAQLPPELASRANLGCRPVTIGTDGNYTGNRWTSGRVPFVYAANVTPAMQAAMALAMQELQNIANVTFVPRTNEADYVSIRDSVFNGGPIGRIGGIQALNVYNWNVRFEMVHALMHVLGYWHEHQRPDRDQYVQVQTANVDPTQATDFEIVPTGNVFARPYDFDSVMHFAATQGGLNGATTLVVLPPNGSQQSAIGQRTHISTGDRDALRLIYGSATPPTLSAVTPSSVNCWQPGQVVITGTLMDEVTRVLIDGNPLATFTAVSPTQVRITVTNLLLIGPHTIQVDSAIGRSTAIPFQVVGNDPPVLEVPAAAVRNLSALYKIHTDNRRANILLAAFDNLPSAVPGVISLGLGNQFSSCVSILSGVGGANGIVLTSLTPPLSIPSGSRMWFQSIVYDPNNLVLPVTTSAVAEVRIF